MIRNQYTKNIIIARLLAVVLILSCLLPLSAIADATPVPEPEFIDTYDAENPLSLRDRDLQGTACLLMDRATGRVLYDKNGEKRRFPASTTKIMTLLLALEYGHLNEVITIPDEAKDVPGDSSRTGVLPGEQMPFIDLLYGMMIVSGNDAANAVAVIVSGSVPAFVARMNERARELGCVETNFMNSHGYHDENHYTTAKDMALITREGMRHNTFRAISSVMEYTMAATATREKLRMATKNAMFVRSNKFYYAPMMGVKTGFHSKAGQCFVGSAFDKGVYLITVTFHTSPDGRWMDTKRMMEYGYAQYKTYTFDELWRENPFYVSIENAATDDSGKGLLSLDYVPGSTIEKFTATRLPDEYDQLLTDYKAGMKLEYSNALRAPIRKGDIIGELKMQAADGEILETKLIASRDVDEFVELSPAEQLFPWLNLTPVRLFLGIAALILLLTIIIRIRIGIKKSKKRKELYRLRLEAYERYRAAK